jgi:hypothetical protein
VKFSSSDLRSVVHNVEMDEQKMRINSSGLASPSLTSDLPFSSSSPKFPLKKLRVACVMREAAFSHGSSSRASLEIPASVPGEENLADNTGHLAEQYIILMDLPKEGTNTIIPNSFVDIGGKRRRQRLMSAHVQQSCFALNSPRTVLNLDWKSCDKACTLVYSRLLGSAGMVKKVAPNCRDHEKTYTHLQNLKRYKPPTGSSGASAAASSRPTSLPPPSANPGWEERFDHVKMLWRVLRLDLSGW